MRIKHYTLLAAGVTTVVVAQTANADLVFAFAEVGGDVVMTSSGTFDTTGLQSVGPFGWGGTGIEENGNHDIMGGASFGGVDASFAFNDGTDFSQWASANGPWTASNFDPAVTGGSKSFTTYVRDGGPQLPGLGIRAEDMDGALWTTDQIWTWSGATFGSLSMIEGSYSVSDSVTGETITIAVPAPASIGLFLGLGLAGMRRRRE